jgi:Winged helix DNA-binding domain
MTDAERRARLVHNHRLLVSRRNDDVVEITESLVCLHSSDPATVFLSVLSRMRTPSIDAVAAALYRDRTLLRHHGMRRTMWVYPLALAPHVHWSTTIDIATKESAAFTKEVAGQTIGWSIESAGESLLGLLRAQGALSARQIGKLRPDLAVKITRGTGNYVVEQAAHTRLLLNLGFEGRVVRTEPTGSWTSAEYRWAAMDRWLPGALAPIERTVAERTLVEAYVRRFGPVTPIDVAWWTGWSIRRVSVVLESLGLVPVRFDDGSKGVLLESEVGATISSGQSVAFLPGLDPTAMGWKQRDWYMGAHGALAQTLVDRAGNIGPTVWLDGRVVGGWVHRPDGEISYSLLEPVPKQRLKAIATEAESVEAAIGTARVNTRFPAPLQKSLLASE